MNYELKTDARNFRLICSGRKTFEIVNQKLNDTDFTEGDTVIFLDIENGRKYRAVVGYSAGLGLEGKPDFAVLSILKEEK